VIKQRKIRVGHAEMRNIQTILIRKPHGKKPFVRHSIDERRILKWTLRNTEHEDVDWFHLDQDKDQCLAHMNTVMNLWFP
jgi:hypothetical protein